ncbi:hypothetical protein EIL87_04835 [Saccharopolyspora rhizosphaerae]|uniref:Uncharacterized protein n=1 Tax=Saccharopolyspora rhizosphaerae TaxID=2492662 RepID=A0A3R8QTX3_9PSEU|nr:hypothetical protein [Saccharopolyspora rhizosphaerae]RRO19424.1 hypothetical protein EIL87_04835 [Saccharopolyspora rhizosphaerae]
MSSLLIVFIGMSVPIMAAAPFYIADRRGGARETSGGAQLQPGITEAPRIWPPAQGEPAREVPEARTPEESNALADTVRIEKDRVAQP